MIAEMKRGPCMSHRTCTSPSPIAIAYCLRYGASVPIKRRRSGHSIGLYFCSSSFSIGAGCTPSAAAAPAAARRRTVKVDRIELISCQFLGGFLFAHHVVVALASLDGRGGGGDFFVVSGAV